MPLYCDNVIKLSCNHIFHYNCINNLIKAKWSGPRIYFKFLYCPLCNEHGPINPEDYIEFKEFYDILNHYWNLYKHVMKLSEERLKIEGLDKSQELLDKNNPWYNNPIKYALKKFAF